MNRVIALWAVPRSVSTAFEQMTRARGDLRVIHEPFLPYYYYGEERVNDHFSKGVEPDPSHHWERILERIHDEAGEGPVFFKDMAYHVSRCASPELLANFDSSFLVRDPERTLPSLFRLLPEATMEETGFEQQLRLMRMVRDRGEELVVVDAERLREDAGPVVEEWCRRMGLEFMPEALHWDEGEPSEEWRPWRAWHREAIHSTGFESATDEHKTEEAAVPPEVMARCKEVYAEIVELAGDVAGA
jgi:hypothetical protein